jgi:hypothetical protein
MDTSSATYAGCKGRIRRNVFVEMVCNGRKQILKKQSRASGRQGGGRSFTMGRARASCQQRESLLGQHKCNHARRFQRIYNRTREGLQCDMCGIRCRKNLLQCRRCQNLDVSKGCQQNQFRYCWIYRQICCCVCSPRETYRCLREALHLVILSARASNQIRICVHCGHRIPLFITLNPYQMRYVNALKSIHIMSLKA